MSPAVRAGRPASASVGLRSLLSAGVLLRREILEEIDAGRIDLVFRRWKRPTVRSGGSLMTPAGVLEIRSVRRVERQDLGEEEARRAGFDDLASLLSLLDARGSGEIYRVEVGDLTPDPRVELREQTDLEPDDVEAISHQLASLDSRSKTGPWTMSYLQVIAENPHVLAETLASSVGVEKQVFKRRVRRLKELGLTISLSPGYELSPRGRDFLRRLGL